MLALTKIKKIYIIDHLTVDHLTMEQKRMRYQKFLCEAVKYPAFIYATKECSTSSKMYG